MNSPPIRFEDGAGYERMMGVWSRTVGADVLDWLAPPPGLSWLDIGCGNGAFTELLAGRCAPAALTGIDPSPAQLAYARGRPASRLARFDEGSAEALPYADASFDAAAFALVIFFVPDPARGLAEARRVVRPGGSVTAYAWDLLEGGFPLAAIQDGLRAIGRQPLLPPSPEVSRLPALQALWRDGGLVEVRARRFDAERRFASFDEYWEVAMHGSSIGPTVRALPEDERQQLRDLARAALPAAPDGSLVVRAFANAVTGVVPP